MPRENGYSLSIHAEAPRCGTRAEYSGCQSQSAEEFAVFDAADEHDCAGRSRATIWVCSPMATMARLTADVESSRMADSIARKGEAWNGYQLTNKRAGASGRTERSAARQRMSSKRCVRVGTITERAPESAS